MDTIDVLRLKIKKRHQEEMERELNALERLSDAGVLSDLEVLKQYLSQSLASTNGTASSQPIRFRETREGSMRGRVLKVITGSWASIGEIASATGIGVKKVRGVVYAPTLKSKIDSRENEGKKEYRLKSGQAPLFP
jgi:hypothetical protein